MVEKIAILGDFNPIHYTLHSLNDSTRAIQKYLGKTIQFDWIATDIFNAQAAFEQHDYKGLWIAPGSPYRSMENVLQAIAYARENNIPTLGNCGGFQHMIIEFARNCCNIADADHAETNPDSPDILIKKSLCSLKGEQEKVKILDRNSILYKSLGEEIVQAKYYCSYDINEEYTSILEQNGITFTAQSDEGHYRSFEIKEHPFFVGTLFQPALTSTNDEPNPLIVQFVTRSLAANF